MSKLALASLIVVLASQTNLHISHLKEPVVVATSTQGNVTTDQLWFGWTQCTTTLTAGKKIGYVEIVAYTPEAEDHELGHAVDCVDDGEMNGSPLPYTPYTNDPAHEWIAWSRLHPEEALKIIERLNNG